LKGHGIINLGRGVVTNGDELDKKTRSAVAIFLGTVWIEYEQRKSEAACPYLNAGPIIR